MLCVLHLEGLWQARGPCLFSLKWSRILSPSTCTGSHVEVRRELKELPFSFSWEDPGWEQNLAHLLTKAPRCPPQSQLQASNTESEEIVHHRKEPLYNQLVIQEQMVSPENIHTSSTVWSGQAVFRYVYAHTINYICNNKQGKRLWIWAWKVYTGELGGRNGRGNYIITLWSQKCHKKSHKISP